MAITTANTFEAPDPAITPEGMIEAARALRPRLREEQAETELRGCYSPELHEAFARAGFYRLMQPRRFGGFEFDVPTFLKVVIEVARGCPGTGWCLCLAAGHHIQMAGIFPEEVQVAAYGTAEEFAAPCRPIPLGTASRVAEGWRVNGNWDYCSGAPYSTHAILGVHLEGDDVDAPLGQVLVPRDMYTVRDDWRGTVLGMSGSGSNTISVVDALVPEGFVVPGSFRQGSLGAASPGYLLHGNPMYTGTTEAYGALEIAAILVGTARAMADEYERLLREKRTMGPEPRPRYQALEYQQWFTDAIAKIEAAETLVIDGGERYMQCCEASVKDPDGPWRAELARIDLTTHVVTFDLAWQAVSLMFGTAGSSEGPRNGSRIQRYYRDFSMARTNVMPKTVSSQHNFVTAHFGLVE